LPIGSASVHFVAGWRYQSVVAGDAGAAALRAPLGNDAAAVPAAIAVIVSRRVNLIVIAPTELSRHRRLFPFGERRSLDHVRVCTGP
jgi:hypothetical protein